MKNGIWVNNFYSLFSLLSLHFILFSSLSLVPSHRFPLFSSHMVRFFFFFNLRSVWRWPLSPEAQAACARLVSSLLTTYKPSSSPKSKTRKAIVIALQSHRSVSLFFGGWLFWLLLVGWFWLMVVGWSGCGCEIWDGYEIWDGPRSGCGLWEWDWVVGVRFVAV